MRSIAHKIWYIILIFIILLPGIGVAQSSFQKISPDKNGVDRLNAITEKYFNYSLSKSIESSSEAIALSNSIHYKKGLTNALINLGEIN